MQTKLSLPVALHRRRLLCRRLATAACALLLAAGLHAQQTPAPGAGADDEIVEMSVFEVNASRDTGYTASATLAGSRLNTELANTPASISVLTSEFLSDIGALDVYQALEYGLNTGREFAYHGLDVQQGDFNVQIRGLGSTSRTRDFFKWYVSSDAYNVDRIDLSRGPNSVLFGIGGAGGIVNAATKQARLRKDSRALTLRAGSWDNYRAALDVNQSIGRDAAVRVNTVWQNRKGWRDFENVDFKGIAAAFKWRPHRNTEIRLQGEYGRTDQVLASAFPMMDYISHWLNGGSRILKPADTIEGTGVNNIAQTRLIYDPLSGSGLRSWYRSRQTTQAEKSTATNNIPSFTDFDIIPREASLIGPGSTTNNKYSTHGVVVEQRLGRLTAELAYNHQKYHRMIYYPVQWGQLAVYADPNYYLPNNLLPDGTNPNSFNPDLVFDGTGYLNPNAGRFYVESSWSNREHDFSSDALRLTLAYELDLRRRKLGYHRFVGLLSREESNEESDVQSQVYTNPPGTDAYPNDLSHVRNQIIYRAYLDFTSHDMSRRGMFNPADHPIYSFEGQGGVIAGFRRTGDRHNISRTIITSAMLAGQSAFLDNRINLTWGLRRDEQDVNAGKTAQVGTWGVFGKKHLGETREEFAGNTASYGAVVWPLRWLAAFYNRANNFTPQSGVDVNRNPIAPVEGKGEDFGLKLRLFNNKINLTATRYKVFMENAPFSDTRMNTMRSVVGIMWDAIPGGNAHVLPTNLIDVATQEATGYEVELTANLTRDWRLSINGSQADRTVTDPASVWGGYLAANHATWADYADTLVIGGIPGYNNNPTVGNGELYLNTQYTGLRAANGFAPRQHSKYRLNFFTAYTLRTAPGLLRGLTLGAGANYRGKAVTGYGPTMEDPRYVVYGNSQLTANAMISWGCKTPLGPLRLQLNIQNLLANDDLIITDKDDTGTYRYRFITPREVSLTATLTF
jgi:outer membrane receptor for ferric coprogen and ferric-rhodotorulic acid